MLSTYQSSVTSSDPASETLERLPFQVIHATKGRLRLRLSRLKHDPIFAKRVEILIRSIDGVTGVQIKPVTMSLTVDFYARGCSESLLLDAIAEAIDRAETVLPHRLTTTALAERLDVTPQALTRNRMQINFSEWSQARDPEGLGWHYDPVSGTFYTDELDPYHSSQELSKGQRILQALTQATGSRMGAAMGRLAGQTIGLLLLGTAGMAVGAEVGTFVGEIVGAELAVVEAIEAH